MLKKLKNWRSKRRMPHTRPVSPSRLTMPFDTYESRTPTAQNCIDAVPGWNSRFPDEYGLVAGNIIDFNDGRILWAIERFGDLSGTNVLEIGPMEGAHSSLLERRGARVTAVEASKRAFLKCLITKEITGLTQTRFLLGDCVPFLEENATTYDMIVACGVLYHMQDPLRFLEAVAARTNALYLWTSFIDDDVITADSPQTEGYRTTQEDCEFRGQPVTLFRRGYVGVNHNAEFCGGIFDDPRWMSRSSILTALHALGFDDLEITHEATPVPHEPCFSIFARRSKP
jgi:SAM-dependent methyltransferase